MLPRFRPPTFLGIGAQRSGTTSLYEYLAGHPHIFMTREKELHYFDKPRTPFRFHLDYHRHFLTARRHIGASGEVTPAYCVFPDAIERIYQYNPRLKLLMLLRNPVTRAVSQYAINQLRGHDSMPMADAFDPETEAKRIEGRRRNFIRYSYLLRGRYVEQLDRIYRYFPASQVLVQRFDEFVGQPEASMRAITDFLGVEPLSGVEYKPHNLVKAEYDGPDPAIRARLANYFAPHNALLTERYGIRTDDWA